MSPKEYKTLVSSADSESVEGYLIVKGKVDWHDGPGWYYWLEDYPDEGVCGAFSSKGEAVNHAAEEARLGGFFGEA